MRDLPPVAADHEVVHLLPNQISTCQRYNVRPFSSGDSDEEDKRIELLAASIEVSGQLDSVVITPERVLVAGHRRRRAIILINERRTARGQPLQRVRCFIDRTGGDFRRKAIQSNLHRKEATVMDTAYLIAQIRQEHGWRDWKGTRQVADYLGVEPPTVIAIEKFLGAEKELQNKLHGGVISAQSASDLMRASDSPSERQELLRRAAEIQEENRTNELVDAYQSGRMRLRDASASMEKHRRNLAQPDNRIKHPAIVQAIREHHAVARVNGGGEKGKRLALSRAELLAGVNALDSALFPPSVRMFARFFVDEYATGHGTTEDLQERVMAVCAIYTPAESSDPRKLVTN